MVSPHREPSKHTLLYRAQSLKADQTPEGDQRVQESLTGQQGPKYPKPSVSSLENEQRGLHQPHW